MPTGNFSIDNKYATGHNPPNVTTHDEGEKMTSKKLQKTVLIKKLTVKNSVLIARGLPYQDRKKVLEQYAIGLCPAPLPPPTEQRQLAAQ